MSISFKKTSPTANSPLARRSPWSAPLFTVHGIAFRMHITLFVFIALIALEESEPGHHAIIDGAFLCLLIASILLHEFSHVVVAALMRVRIREIVLYPFGGVPVQTGEPSPAAEFFVALAGPLMNGAIVIALTPFVSPETLLEKPDIYGKLLAANSFLFCFNLIPALPLDGGRMVRAALALCRVERAALVTSRISQLLGLLLGMLALYFARIDLLIVASIVFLSSVQEHFQEKTRKVIVGKVARDVMIDASALHVFTHGMSMAQALAIALKSFQDFFPVIYGGEVIGVVEKDTLISHAATGTLEGYLSGIMQREFESCDVSTQLTDIFDRLFIDRSGPIVVRDGTTFAGLLVRDKILEYLMVSELKDHAPIVHDEELLP